LPDSTIWRAEAGEQARGRLVDAVDRHLAPNLVDTRF
jgi:hypothetical protein